MVDEITWFRLINAPGLPCLRYLLGCESQTWDGEGVPAGLNAVQLGVLQELATLLPTEVTDAEGLQRRFQIELILAAPAVQGDGSSTATVLRHKAGGEGLGFTSDDPMLEAL